LQTDYIDLYQLHGGTLEDPIDDVIEAFESLKKSCKIRYYGISSIRPAVIREYVKRSAIVSVMMQYSLLDRRPEEEMLSFLKDRKIGILARGSLAKGLLAGKPPGPFLNYRSAEVEKMALAVSMVSSIRRKPSETAIHFVLDNPAISSAVVGIRTESQLMEAVSAIGSPGLTPDQMESLTQTLPSNHYTEHR
jgi:aryl-alcohol dehydrogenase-like predicted oxidoreductase